LFHKGIAIPGQKTPLPGKFCQNRPSQDLAGPPKKEAQGVQDPQILETAPERASRRSTKTSGGQKTPPGFLGKALSDL